MVTGDISREKVIPVRRKSKNGHLHFTNALIFFGLALCLNIYVTISSRALGSLIEPITTLHIDNYVNERAAKIPTLRNRDELRSIDENKSVHHSFDGGVEDNAYTTDGDVSRKEIIPTASLAIVSACIPGERFPQEYIHISHTNKRRYCQRYNSKCILPTERVDQYSDLHPKWDKLHHINVTLYNEDVDWVLWMDCDSAFTNFEINWYQHLQNYLKSSQLLIVSKDNAGYNLGVFLVPNTSKSRKFIEEMYKMRFQLDKRFFHKDQSALKELIKNHPKIESQIEIVPQQLLNAYLDNTDGEQWNPYHFIMHQVFCEEVQGCLANFSRVMKMVTPQLFTNIEVDERPAKEQDDFSRTSLFVAVQKWWNR